MALLRVRWRGLFPALGLLLLLTLGLGPAAASDFGAIEDEFEKAIKLVSPCTVVCIAKDEDPRRVQATSGVVISRKGHILSDGDVGAVIQGQGRQRTVIRKDRIEVRLPDLRGRGFDTYEAVVLRRDRDMDTSLLKLLEVPSGLKWLKVGNSDDLRVGAFTFTMGNAFGLSGEVPPSLTAGVVASLPPATKEGEGRYDRVYTTAAVNPGVNGGPLVDVEGRLVGTISSAVRPTENGGNQPYQFLGRAVPIERLKAFYAKVPEARDIFTEQTRTARSKDAAQLEFVFHRTARRAHASTVSLEIKRKAPLLLVGLNPRNGRPTNIPRYTGPVSGVAISADGYILTSIYHLGNVGSIARPLPGNAPAPMKFKTGFEALGDITAHYQNGEKYPAKLVAMHQGLGVALLKAERPDNAGDLQLLEPVPADWYATGRLVMTIANPFGDKRLEDPLLAFGVLSKQHPKDSSSHWRGQWQTDATGTDATAGAAIVDLRGRLVGVQTLWDPWQHGRNSGISFVVPWSAIDAILPELQKGRSFARPRLGVRWEPVRNDGGMRVIEVVAGGPAEKAGLKKGDVVITIAGKAILDARTAVQSLGGKWSGDKIEIEIERGGARQTLQLVLGEA